MSRHPEHRQRTLPRRPAAPPESETAKRRAKASQKLASKLAGPAPAVGSRCGGCGAGLVRDPITRRLSGCPHVDPKPSDFALIARGGGGAL